MVSPRLIIHHEDATVDDTRPNVGVLRRMVFEADSKCREYAERRDQLRRRGKHYEADKLQIVCDGLKCRLQLLQHEIADREAVL